MPWEAIKYVSSGFTLCAFVVAALLGYLKSRSQEERKRIEAAPPEDRAELVAKTLEIFHVDTQGLTRQQQFDLAMRQVNGRIERFRLVAIVVVVLAFIGAGVSVYAISVEKKTPDQSTTESGAARDKSAQQPTKPADTEPNKQLKKKDPVLETLNASQSQLTGSSNEASPVAGKIPPLVKGGAPVGTTFQYSFTKNDGAIDCVGEFTKLPSTKWEERPAPGSIPDCRNAVTIVEFTERESDDPNYFLLYDEGRGLLTRLRNTEKGQSSPLEWHLASNQNWNVSYTVRRTN